ARAGAVLHLRRLHHARPPEDRVQRRPQLVRYGGEQLILGAVERLRLLARLALAYEQPRALVLDAATVRDVAGDLRRADDPAAGVLDGRHGDGDVYQAAVLGLPHRVEVIHPLPAPDARQHLVLLRVPVDRHDQRDVPADCLGGRPAKQTLGGAVPRRDDSAERLADDDVIRGIDDGGEPRQRELVPASVTDVAGDLRGADDAAGGVPDRGHGDGDVYEPAVLGDAHGLEVIHALAAPELREHLVLFGVPLGGNDERDVTADRFCRRPSEQTLGGPVPGGDDAVECLADDDVVGRLDDGGEPGPGVRLHVI